MLTELLFEDDRLIDERRIILTIEGARQRQLHRQCDGDPFVGVLQLKSRELAYHRPDSVLTESQAMSVVP